MTYQSTGLYETITPEMTPGHVRYATFRNEMLKQTNTLLLVWADLDPTVQQQWEQVAKNTSDPRVSAPARMWDAFAAISNHPDMPMWDGLSTMRKQAWSLAFLMQFGPKDTLPAKQSEAMEQLRQMRAYSKCFTTAFDRKQSVFVLIEQDKTAYLGIAQWIKANVERLGARHPKIISAKATMARFMDFEAKKEPD